MAFRLLKRRIDLSGCAVFALAVAAASWVFATEANPGKSRAEASSSQSDGPPAGAIDGSRFGFAKSQCWRGQATDVEWWWQLEFKQPTQVGAILQIVGDDVSMIRNAPKQYVWQVSTDGKTWRDLPETAVQSEDRAYRIHRLKKATEARYLRMRIAAAEGDFPTLREIEVYPTTDAKIVFPDWAIVVKSDLTRSMIPQAQLFTKLAHSCPGWEELHDQYIPVDQFTETFISAEPRPLCAFMTGTFAEWCKVDREPWRGTAEVLQNGRLPIWASCGGAQGLALLSEVGVDKPWDCPRCRDAKNPKSPIYTHIGHLAEEPCGSYKHCLWEKGPTFVRQIAEDPAFAGVPTEFQIVESHCGQIDHAPAGWTLIVTKGKDGKTPTQCMRLDHRPIYAAQFHIEMDGTPENSRKIMANFLGIAKKWGGYNPDAQLLPSPSALESRL